MKGKEDSVTTIPGATERLFAATKATAETLQGAAAAEQERGFRFVKTLLDDVEAWQKVQQSGLSSAVEAAARWQGQGLRLARAALHEAEEAYQDTRRVNETLAAQATVAAEAGRDLAAAWSKLLLSAAATPFGTYANQFEELSRRLEKVTEQAEANGGGKV